jgi:hypothetical protein
MFAFFAAIAGAIASAASAVGAYLASGTIGALLARTAITALVSYGLNRSISKNQQQTGFDAGSRQMLSPATNHKIPVVYGSAYLGGAITDAQLVDDNKTMWICLTISETTGALFETGSAATYTFNECYRNADRLIFQADGITVDHSEDSDGNSDDSMRGLIKIYMYAGSGASAKQLTPALASCVSTPTITPVNAWSIFPSWTAPATPALNSSMSDLVFALVRVSYNRDQNVTSVGDYQFNIINSMSKSGDVIFDYATNTRYGAGVRLLEIDTGESAATTISRMGLNSYPWITLT